MIITRDFLCHPITNNYMPNDTRVYIVPVVILSQQYLSVMVLSYKPIFCKNWVAGCTQYPI